MKPTRTLNLLTGALLVAGIVLIPSAIHSGNLEPSAAPGPTMRTLDEIQPTWNRIIDEESERFVDALDGSAKLDLETGLVCELPPIPKEPGTEQ